VARPRPEGRFDQLRDAALAVFAAKGLRRARMSDVAAAMGLSTGSLYNYVESKEALFHWIVELGAEPGPVAPPARVPIPTPAPGATEKRLREVLAEGMRLPALDAALARRRAPDARAELEAVVRELYALLARHRTAIELLDRASQDYPELAAAWYGTGRAGALALLARYLEDRARRGRLRAIADPAVAARIVLETVAFWAVHRHWDASPQAVDEREAEDAVVRFIVTALAGRPPAARPLGRGRRAGSADTNHRRFPGRIADEALGPTTDEPSNIPRGIPRHRAPALRRVRGAVRDPRPSRT
jgi:AcrR family transcriptional regulator